MCHTRDATQSPPLPLPWLAPTLRQSSRPATRVRKTRSAWAVRRARAPAASDCTSGVPAPVPGAAPITDTRAASGAGGALCRTSPTGTGAGSRLRRAGTHRDTTGTRLARDRDTTGTRPGRDRDATGTRPKRDGDATGTQAECARRFAWATDARASIRARSDRDATGTRPGRDRDTTETRRGRDRDASGMRASLRVGDRRACKHTREERGEI
eukprot:CAMPEP_0119397698 /NCGR_PEP_ID=MMETSP1334-20130426/140466_1 /TAXON_ID=127549 /ORGANISM="Calcidiscus leptoporus, Strain RCC1130" /LENGTH=211 /DNA_ID=CAMNT_0007421543 /DNA_START=81 /DNA_END=716 /DNA_ORIENTATION=-